MIDDRADIPDPCIPEKIQIQIKMQTDQKRPAIYPRQRYRYNPAARYRFH